MGFSAHLIATDLKASEISGAFCYAGCQDLSKREMP
jgi:hypothetical protein